MLLVPGHHELLLLAAHVQAVAVVDVEVNAGHAAFHFVSRLDCALLEVDLHVALAVLMCRGGQHTEAEVAAVRIHFTNADHQIVRVSFHHSKNRIVRDAILATAVLPALTLVAHHPCWYNVLPLSTLCAGLLRSDVVAA